LSEPDETQEEKESIRDAEAKWIGEDGEDKEKEQPPSILYNLKVRKPFLQRMKDAVKKSEGKYETTSALARSAIEEKVRWIEQGMPEPGSDEDWADEKPTKRDVAHEAQVKALLKLIDEELPEPIFVWGSKDTDDFIEATKKFKGKPALWSDNRIQSSMRLHLRDFACLGDAWDGERKWDPKEGTRLITIFTKQLQIPRSTASGLVKDPECDTSQCKSCPHPIEAEEEKEENEEEE